MSQDNQPEETVIKDWIFRIKRPKVQNEQAKVMLLIHGYFGNEKAMWILTNPIPENYVMIAPRAPEKMGPNQYSWHEIGPKWPSLKTYKNLSDQLLERVDDWLDDNQMNINHLDVMGFSQGAVMAYGLAFLYPERIGKVAALASFIPQSWKSDIDPSSIKDKDFFIAHGTEDEITPIKRAKESAEWMKENGANITFCEADIGHKLSADCFNGLGDFFAE